MSNLPVSMDSHFLKSLPGPNGTLVQVGFGLKSISLKLQSQGEGPKPLHFRGIQLVQAREHQPAEESPSLEGGEEAGLLTIEGLPAGLIVVHDG